jgi:hypothetical protein
MPCCVVYAYACPVNISFMALCASPIRSDQFGSSKLIEKATAPEAEDKTGLDGLTLAALQEAV